jgi:hypothetical protein
MIGVLEINAGVFVICQDLKRLQLVPTPVLLGRLLNFATYQSILGIWLFLSNGNRSTI